MAAAISMLDEQHSNLPTSQGDYNTYVVGSIQSHNVVIACLPSGIYGTASAATVAATMRLSYPLIQVGLMVGIGGSVPSAQADISLGDVVNEKWQAYAAITAAAYTKELLSIMGVMGVTKTERIEDVILRNLSQYDHERVHRRLSHKRVTGTTQWFINHPKFQDWLVGDLFSGLWCTGKIGSGKTILATSAVDVLKCRGIGHPAPTIFFYCETDRLHSEHGTFILTSYINQLYHFLSKDPTTSYDVEKVRNSIASFFGPDRVQPDFENLEDILVEMNRLIPGATYIIDGLELLLEGDIRKLLKVLRSLLEFNESSARILVFSRDYLPGNIDISTAVPSISQISTSSNVGCDIEVYISESMNEKSIYKKLTNNAKLLEDMKQKLLEHSSEMFLWVYLQLEILWDTCVTDSEVRSALNRLPKDLEETYHRCLQRVNSSDARTMKVSKWFSFASRPLHVEELREAVAFDFEDGKWDAERIPMRSFVIGCCANLVVEDPVDNSVRFAHPSVGQYLQKNNNVLTSWPDNLQQGQLEEAQILTENPGPYIAGTRSNEVIYRWQSLVMEAGKKQIRVLLFTSYYPDYVYANSHPI
ncbi:hypothetical protein BJX99DRAFT_254802 [Aspergillus californicus]